MINKALEKIEEYNNGGLFNEPITFSNNVNHVDTAKLLDLFTPPIGFGSFSFPKEKTVDLNAELTLSRDKIDNSSPDVVDKIIRMDLARQLINKILSEDLITIEHDANEMDPLHQSVTFRTKLKIVQEK